MVMEAFQKHAKGAQEERNRKKKAEEERRREAERAKKKREEEEAGATIKELTNEEADKIQKEIEEVGI